MSTISTKKINLTDKTLELGGNIMFATYMGITKQQPMTTIAHALRPRERFQKYGAEYVDLRELIAIILRTGTVGNNVLALSKEALELLEMHNYKVSIDQLTAIDGISSTKAISLLAAIELGTRIREKERDIKRSIQSADDCIPYLHGILNQKKEHFAVLYLDTKNIPVTTEIISIGTLDASLVHPREVFEPAYRSHSARIILAHNHPSGDTSPSPEDIHITKQLIDAGDILGIQVLDHLVVSGNGYTSLADANPSLFS
jgi:DNA repair protein RadC